MALVSWILLGSLFSSIPIVLFKLPTIVTDLGGSSNGWYPLQNID